VIFLDTSFLHPLFNTRDKDHLRVREVEVFEGYRGRRLSDPVVTTPQVIFETITRIRFGKGETRPDARTRHRQAVHAGERLLGGRLAQIFVVMEKLDIREALAVDDGFTHRFIARPGPLRRE
jgi:predicted nucleic acid-binding protein